MRKECWKVTDFGLNFGLDNNGDKMSPVKTKLEARNRLVSYISRDVVPGIIETVMTGVRGVAKDIMKNK